MGDKPSPEKNTTGDKRLPIESVLNKKLVELECKPQDVKSRYVPENATIAVTAAIPRGQPLEWIVHSITLAAHDVSYTVTDCVYDEKKHTCIISLSSKEKGKPNASLTITYGERFFSGTAKMAIVIAGMEDTSDQIDISLLSLPEPLSVSVVPMTKKAGLIAQLARQHKKEILIRLPLEPLNQVPENYEKSTVMVHYSKEAVHSIFTNAIRIVPEFNGFNNLWGARACEDSRIMTIVLSEVKKQHGYFIESKSAKSTVVPTLSADMDIPYAQSLEHIDKKTSAAIAAEIRRIGAIAQVNGDVVVAVSASKQVCDAIVALRPWFKQNGIRLTFASEVTKKEKDSN